MGPNDPSIDPSTGEAMDGGNGSAADAEVARLCQILFSAIAEGADPRKYADVVAALQAALAAYGQATGTLATSLRQRAGEKTLARWRAYAGRRRGRSAALRFALGQL
jgi:hypothetical protein